VKRLIYLLLVLATIWRHSRRNQNFTESVMAVSSRNRKYAESVIIYTFGAETETEIRLIFTRPHPALSCAAVSIFLQLNLSKCFPVVLSLCSLVASTVSLVLQCCHHFISVCDRSSPIFSFKVVLRLAVHSFSSTVPCWLFCLATVHSASFSCIY